MPHTNPKDNKILKLEKENEKLKKQLTKFSKEKYGLFWLDVPEAFEDDVENKLPILEEVPKLAIKSKDNKPTHLLIEGDNYHALTCLNYTHKGKIDVIYIDPPYNTGSDGFKYKDKRILDKYPDGTEIPVDHPLRHSYWLSFMRKRLELAKDILNETGTIFISIDDNELAQLKLLCDEIFGKNNFITAIPRITSYQRSGQENYMNVSHDYILSYSYSSDFQNNIERKTNNGAVIKKDNIGTYIVGDTKAILAALSQGYSKGGDYDFKYNGKIYRPITKEGKRNRWLWTKKRMEAAAKLGILVETKNTLRMQVYLDKKFEERTNKMVAKDNKLIFHTADFMSDKRYTNVYGTNTLNKILGKNKFNNPKPVDLIKKLVDFLENKNAIVLDFFAGSGTTAQAVMELNKEDEGNRQFILITNNDEITNGEKHKIMTDICYPRVKKIIKGYNSKNGLGNSIRYYKTDFVGKNNILNADDADKIHLAHNAGGMLAIAENTLEEIEKNNYYQIFENDKQYTAVYFREEFDKFDNFIKKVISLKKSVVVYVFSWEKSLDISDFEDFKNITLKTIPEPILEIYKKIYNLV